MHLEKFSDLYWGKLELYKGCWTLCICYIIEQLKLDPMVCNKNICNHAIACIATKGQLISEWIHEVIVSPKIWTKHFQDFCSVVGQKSWQIFILKLTDL